MLERIASAMALSVVAFGAQADVAQQDGENLIINGSFEESTLNPGARWNTLGNGSTAINGWVTLGSGIDYFGEFFTAAEGFRSLDINNASSGGGVAQTFETTIGATYVVEFDMSANMYGGPGQKIMSVTAGQTSEDFMYDFVAREATAVDPKWIHYTMTFTATEENTTLSFIGVSGSAFGAALDNVVVTASLPAPGSVAAFGLAGLAATRRRR